MFSSHSINHTTVPLDQLIPSPQVEPTAARKQFASLVFPKQEPIAKDPDGKGYYLFKGYGGVPFRSRSQVPPDIKAEDLKRQPVLVLDAIVEVLTLPADLARYTEIWDKISKGVAVLSAEDRQWDPATKSWTILLRYGLRYWEMPA